MLKNLVTICPIFDQIFPVLNEQFTSLEYSVLFSHYTFCFVSFNTEWFVPDQIFQLPKHHTCFPSIFSPEFYFVYLFSAALHKLSSELCEVRCSIKLLLMSQHPCPKLATCSIHYDSSGDSRGVGNIPLPPATFYRIFETVFKIP